MRSSRRPAAVSVARAACAASLAFAWASGLLAPAGGPGSPAAAEVHGSVALSGALRFDAPALGGGAAVTVYPLGLWGLRAEVLAVGAVTLVEGQLARGLGATWRHLVLGVHAGAGADVRRGRAVLAGGVTVDLGLRLGPLGLESDLALHAIVGGDTLVTWTLGLAALF